MLLNVFIPKPDRKTTQGIAAKSAIVGAPTPDETDSVIVYYEGNLNGAVNLNEYYEKLLCAAGRLKQRYPTVAMRMIPLADLHPVATYETETWSIVDVTDADALISWTGEPLEKIAGKRLPIGPIDWSRAAEACQDARPHNRSPHNQLEFITRAGQILRFNPEQRSAVVLPA
jgi:hypothetical protein